MALNIVKLCVGIASVEELQAHLDFRISEKRAIGQRHEPIHTTRMMPKRVTELLDGGSLYWVIKGKVQVRQMLVDVRPFTDAQGIKRCDLVMEPRLIMTEWQPRRAFQGWRYLKVEDAPHDLGNMAGGIHALPPELRSELANLGLL